MSHPTVENGEKESGSRPTGRGRKFFRRLAIVLGGLLGALLVAVLVLFALAVPIDLSALRADIESAASQALGREIAIDGPITVAAGIAPTAEIRDVRVGNPQGWPEGDLARLQLARLQIRLLPILQGEVSIAEIAVDGLEVELETNADGDVNWVFHPAAKPSEGAPPVDATAEPAFRFVELGALSLRDITLKKNGPNHPEPLVLEIDQVTGTAAAGEAGSLQIIGSIQGAPYQASFESGSLAEVVDPSEPWPVKLSADILGARLDVGGTVEEPLRGRGVDVRFNFSGPMLHDLGALLETSLPPVQAFQFNGRIQESGDRYSISELAGELAATGFTGSFEADLSGDRPRFFGAIDVASIDAGPLFAAIRGEETFGEEEQGGAPESPVVGPSAPPSGADDGLDLDAPILTAEPFTLFDAQFRLDVGEVLNAPVSLSDVSLQVSVTDGELVSPSAISIAGVPFKGRVTLAPGIDAPALSISLEAAESDIGELAAMLMRAEGIEGYFGSARLDFVASGETLRSLVTTSELTFDLADASLSYGHDTDGEPVEFTLDSASMSFPAAGESRVGARGSLLGEPFTLAFNGGTFIDNFVERTWPIDFSATGGGAELRIDGTVRKAQADTGSDIEFSIRGDRIGGLAAWLGFSPDAGQAYALSGRASHTERGTTIDVGEARIGNSAFTGEVGLQLRGDTEVTVVDLDFEQLDLKGLGVVFAGREVDKSPDSGKEVLTIDVPILPTGIEIFDSDLDIAIGRVMMEPTDATDVAFTAQIRDGFMADAPVGLAIGGARFDGSFSLDLRQDVPRVGAKVHSDQVDVGRLLEQLGISKGLNVTADRFDLDLALEGASPRQILERSEFFVSVKGGLLNIYPPGMEGSLGVRLREGTISATRGEPISLEMKGAIDETPVRIALMTYPLAEFAEPKDRLQTKLEVALANARVSLIGTAPLPVDARNLHFTMDFGGERFSDFDELLGVSLPPVGPYRARGQFGSRSSGYYVDDLILEIGDSVLTGKLDFQTALAPPRLDVDLVAKTIQLDDFAVGDWSASEDTEEGPEKGPEEDPGEPDSGRAEENPAGEEDELRPILSPEVLKSIDGRVNLQVEEVLSGADQLGNGVLALTLEKGRLVADPLSVDVSGGVADLRFAVEPTDTDVMLEASAELTHFDYGILARRIDPTSDVGGEISVDIEIRTRGPDLARVMEGSDGRLNFAVWPADLNAEIFDLWAVNLFLALMPSLDSGESSRVNCIVGRFQIDDGIMRPAALLVDSTNIQASGDGTIDFKSETVDFRAAPRSKRPQMFSARTPVQVTGKFSDFNVGLAPGAAFGTVIRMITSPVVVPFQWVFVEQAPPDGKVACDRAWSGEEAAQ